MAFLCLIPLILDVLFIVLRDISIAFHDRRSLKAPWFVSL